jgi:hypothetical protein
MRYLGRIGGDGLLLRDGEAVSRAGYDFEGFTRPRGDVMCSGEITLGRAALESVFRKSGVQLRTDDGRMLDLRFSDKTLGKATVVAEVEVTGELPGSQAEWVSGSTVGGDSAAGLTPISESAAKSDSDRSS